MYLKSIEAYGFKSFADKTEINFCENINGIVGPNGSGKSNVVDAVRWVLGEQSVKSLRGETSSDVIFSGSKSRKPLNRASVTLVFDNSDMHLPINYNEVSVKRVMYRTGENEYFLNNERCRLKDITNILTDSGADKEAFNIISQGKIDEILSTKASDRRIIFESASGVLKYKKRKVEALKKLERTNSNIDRVNDIISELETNLEPLKKQSEDAKKYLSYKEELKNIEISLIAHDLNNYNYESKKLKEKLDYLKDELAALSSNNSSYDVEILEKKDELKKLEDSINEKQNLLIELTKNIEKIDANIRILKERQKYVEDSNINLDNILTLKEEILKLETEINNINLEINSFKQELSMINEEYNSNNKSVLELKDKKNKLVNSYDKNNRRLTDLEYKIKSLENNINNNNSLPNSIRSIMNNPRLLGCHNVIGKLIEVSEEYSICISIALGGSANYLVVDTTNDAKEMANYLKNNKLGRVTFYPIDVIKSRSIDVDTINKIKNIEGFINTADKLVNYKEIYKNIILNQLGNVIVVKDIDNANYISKLINHRYKIVTLDGQVVNVGGSITGGSVNNNTIIKEKYDLDNYKLDYDTLIKKNKDIELEISNLDNELNNYEKLIYSNRTRISIIEDNINNCKVKLRDNENRKSYLSRELKDLEAISNDNSDSEVEMLLNTYYAAISNRDNLSNDIELLKKKRENINDSILELESISKKSNNYINNKERESKELEIKLNTMNIKMDNLLLNLSEEYNMTFDAAINKYKLDIDEKEAREKVRELKDNIKSIDFVNIGAIDEYNRVSERYNFLCNQKEDLYKAENTLLEIIDEMDSIMKDKFLKTFEEIRLEFKKVFVSMFGGGEAELILTDPDNLLETGIEIQAVPSGKNLKSLSLLSGGEKTFTAISLLFAILNVRPVPFCLLDEVEAALDDANVESFGNYLYKYKNKTQFILITHKKKTMEFANVLYGITMQESGVSKLVSVRLEDIKE